MLREQGHDVKTLAELGKQDLEDKEVIELAKRGNYILVTFDQDFADIITYPPSQYSGIIVLKIPSELPRIVNITLAEFLKSPKPQEIVSKLVILEPNRFRIRE